MYCGIFSRYPYTYIGLIMKCSLGKWDVLIIFLVFLCVLNPALTESFRRCVSTCSHPDCRISVQVCPWFSCWRLVMAEQKNIHLHCLGFFILFFYPSSPSAAHLSVKGFSDFPLELCLRGGMTLRLKGKGSCLQEFWNLWAVGVSRWCCYLISPQTNFRKMKLIMR